MKLTSEHIHKNLENTAGWRQRGPEIVREFKFKNFKEAMHFVNQVAELAEVMDHHPDIFIKYNTVLLILSTHSAGGLTEKDFQLAGKINQLTG